MRGIVNRTVALGLGLVLTGAVLSGCGGSKAATWTFTDAEGAIRNMKDFEGRLMVLAFSNTWCDPCQEAAPFMQALHDKYSASGIKVVFVSAWERGDPAEYMMENGYDYGLMAKGTTVARDYDVDRVPTFIVVADGEIVYRHDGFNKKRTPKQISRAIDRHVKRMVASHGG